MKFKLLYIALAAFTVLSCGSNLSKKSSDTTFSNSGVSFTIPHDWELTEDEDIDGIGYYLSVERSGSDESGIVTMSWIEKTNDDVSPESMASDVLNGMRSTELYAALETENIENASFAGIPALGKQYKANILTMPHSGEIYAFEKGGKVFCIMKQEADEDNSKNISGFQIIENSFTVAD